MPISLQPVLLFHFTNSAFHTPADSDGEIAEESVNTSAIGLVVLHVGSHTVSLGGGVRYTTQHM